MEYFFHGMARNALHPTFIHMNANESLQHPVPTPIPWYTPPPSPTPKVHHWRGGFSDTIDKIIYIVLVVGTVISLCGLLLMWFRVRNSEIDFQRVFPIRDAENGRGATSEEMQQFVREPAAAGSSSRVRTWMEDTEETFVLGADSDNSDDNLDD